MNGRTLLRWLVPGGAAVALVAGGAIVTTLRATADASLPPRTPTQLVADVSSASLDGASGTVVETADLGLPDLGSLAGADSSLTPTTLLTGSHTLRVWYSGPDKARIALLTTMGESDLIRNGSDQWLWSSDTNTATHSVIGAPDKSSASDGSSTSGKPPASAKPSTGGRVPSGLPSALLSSALPRSPQEAADAALALLGTNTAITVDPARVVAGRAVYTLVLAPKQAGSLVDRITIAIDGDRHIPVEVQVFAKGRPKPVFRVGFTAISFARPNDALFRFAPPPGAKVTDNAGKPSSEPSASGPSATAPSTTAPGLPPINPAAGGPGRQEAVVGTDWTAVLAVRTPIGTGTPGPSGKQNTPAPMAGLDTILRGLPTVSGSWGSGRLLSTRIFTALITDDGRVLVGAVGSQQLLAAAADPATALR